MSAGHLGDAVGLMPSATGLTGAEKTVLVHLSWRTNSESGQCNPSISDISNYTGLGDTTIRKTITNLADKGYLIIIRRKRDNGSWSSNQYNLNRDKIYLEAQACACRKKIGPSRGEVPPTSVSEVPPTSPAEGGYLATRGTLTKESNNTLSGARAPEVNDWKRFDEAVREAAGDVPDVASPGIASSYGLRVLLNDRPDHPACTMDEIIAGVISACAWYRSKGHIGKMRNWDMAVKMALEARDKRFAGRPVALPAKAKTSGVELGEAKTWSHERWRAAVGLAVRKGWAWKPEWGPEPGEAGSLVPEDLVDLWKRREGQDAHG